MNSQSEAEEAEIADRVIRYRELADGALVDAAMFKRLLGIAGKAPTHFAGFRITENPLVPPNHIVCVDKAGQVLNIINLTA